MPTFLTILFLIHHTNDIDLITEILERTQSTMSFVEPASLNADQTKAFADILGKLPDSILTDDSVQSSRREERALRGRIEGAAD